MNSSQDPLSYPTCDKLEKKWAGSKSTNLRQEWTNCATLANPISKDPEWGDFTDKEKMEKINSYCCELVMQCSDPNEWLEKNNIKQGMTCTVSKEPDRPHFNVFAVRKMHKMWTGVK